MQVAITITQLVLSVVLSVLILIQTKGQGLGSTFGGGSGTSFTRRGLERVMFRFTFVIAALFLLTSIVELVY